MSFSFGVDYTALITKRRERFFELEEAVGDPDLFSDQKRATAILREHRQLKSAIDLWDAKEDTERQLTENQELAKGEDTEMAEMAKEEIPALEAKLTKIAEDLQYALLPADPDEDRDAIVEIRAGAGGDEASLFAAELMRAYERHATTRGWKCETLDTSPSEVGGFKEITVRFSGEEVFRYLKYESGVHRVQRVPATETQGRIHTSTVTVAVLPEAEEVDVAINPNDLRIDVYRSSGPGGQSVNTTDSAVRITHIPTGLVVAIQDEKSQHKNKDKALRVLRSRLYEMERERLEAERTEARRSMVSTGDRSAKIRTYNYPQGRVTDHRLEGDVKNHALETVMLGNLDPIIKALRLADYEARLTKA